MTVQLIPIQPTDVTQYKAEMQDVQGHGIGQTIWFALERMYPDTKVWETCTPYFDRRNIHFYVNVCGFRITEFFHEKHPMPDTPDDFVGDGDEGMFAFEKQMF